MDSQDWDKLYAGADGDPGTGTEDQFLASASDLTPGSALDLGCGPGALALKLANAGWQVTGIDFSETAIQRARVAAEEQGLSVTFDVADVATWQPAQPFDLVVSGYAMPRRGPVRDRLFALAQESLAPRGRLIIAEWDESMSESWAMSRDELASLPEAQAALDGVEIQCAEIRQVAIHGSVASSIFVLAGGK